jgi:uncharacterized protein YhbP (UPF0306 family)
MQAIPKRILSFIKKHHVLTLSTAKNNVPYSCSCFYVFDEKNLRFIFTSEEKTRHAQELLENKNAAVNIFLETKIIGKIQGIQACGEVKQLRTEEAFKQARKLYLYRFPYAVFSIKDLWAFEVNYIKLTDNRLGFGKKIIWENN